ncbi:MAG: hypothetical protein ACRDZR_07775, partial [Acidimicrobiales bacterium]
MDAPEGPRPIPTPTAPISSAAPTGPAGPAAFALFLDARLPTGGHAHSGGLEQAAAAGRVVD